MGIRLPDRFANPVPLDERLVSYADRTATLRRDDGALGYLHVSRDVMAETTGALWWKVHHRPREVLRWDIVLQDSGEYLQGEYDVKEALGELPEAIVRLRGESYSIEWLAQDEGAAVCQRHFATEETWSSRPRVRRFASRGAPSLDWRAMRLDSEGAGLAAGNKCQAAVRVCLR